MVLFSVATATRRDVEWITRDVGRLVPEAWTRFRDAVPAGERDGSLVDAYAAPAREPGSRGTREGRRSTGASAEDRAHVAIGSEPRPEPELRRSGVSHVLRAPRDALLATRRLARGCGSSSGARSARGHPGGAGPRAHGYQQPARHRVGAGPSLAATRSSCSSTAPATGRRTRGWPRRSSPRPTALRRECKGLPGGGYHGPVPASPGQGSHRHACGHGTAAQPEEEGEPI